MDADTMREIAARCIVLARTLSPGQNHAWVGMPEGIWGRLRRWFRGADPAAPPRLSSQFVTDLVNALLDAGNTMERLADNAQKETAK